MDALDQRPHWAEFAEHWNLLGPPLRPRLADMQRLQAAWHDSVPAGLPDRQIDILMLGVTPEIARFPWCPRAHLTALDSSQLMIQAVWPGDTPDRHAVHGNWLRTLLPAASFDLILTDAGLVSLGGFEQAAVWSREMRRVLRDDGRVVVRHFVRPHPIEALAAVVAAVADGTIRDFNVLKLRLLMAQPRGRTGGISLPATLDSFDRLFRDRAALARKLGCPLQVIATIDSYRGQAAEYFFASPVELASCCLEFSLAVGPTGDYPLAERCPVLTFTPRGLNSSA